LADLDPRPALPPARPLSGAGACLDARWQTVAAREKRLSASRQAAQSAVPSEIPRGLASDRVGGPGRRTHLGKVVGCRLPAGWKWSECLEVSRSIYLPDCPE